MGQADFATAFRNREEIKITVRGRRTGRPVTLPVWFVLDGKTLWLLPLHGSGTQWFRNVLAGPTITLRAGRQILAATARPGRARAVVGRVLQRFRKKYSAELVAQYYDHSDVVVEVPVHSGRGHTVPHERRAQARRPTPNAAGRDRRRRSSASR